ncbi:MAG: DNA polymerase [bacterium]
MTQADGYYRADGGIGFRFKKQRKIERCKHLLRKAEIAFVVNEYKDATSITIPARCVPLWLRQFRTKTFGFWLLDENPDVFFDELPNWDGYYPAPNSIQYSTCNKQNADIVQALAHMSGRTACIRLKKHSAKNLNWSDAYVVDIWLTPKNSHIIANKPVISDFAGMVYCAETPTGYFLVRRNGKVWITGNSGRNVQLQNLPQNHMPDLEAARNLVRDGDYDAVKTLYSAVPDVLAELIRTAFVPAPGKKLIVADFSAIEARVIAWLAGEQWRMDVFKNGGDIYCASASQMFKVPVEKHGVNGHLRQKGKIAELALGFGGSVGALKAMGAIEAGMKEDELAPLVKAWRESNPNIVKLWWAVDEAVMKAVRDKTTTHTHGITFTVRSGMLFITLPSGRQLSYVKPRIGENRFGSPSVTYMGAGNTKKWERIESYGPKFVENCVAAGTLVITDHGCVPIEQIKPFMRVWDGEAFVRHSGVIARGYQETISVNGLHMTPDHKILTTKGWMKSGEAGNRFDWAAVPLPDGFEPGGEYCSGQSPVAVSVRMRKRSCCSFPRFTEKEVSNQILRMHDASIDIQGPSEAWYVASSRLGGMAFHETAVLRPEPSRLSQLWRTWNHGLQSLAGKLRGFLGRYGTDMEKRIGSGSRRQQSRLQSRELQMDDAQRELYQQKDYEAHLNAVVESPVIDCVGAERYWGNDAPVSSGSRVADRVSVHSTGLEEAVYDLLNCGPRHRFAVWDGCKARIVSNCVQGISRDILCYAMQTLRCCRIVAHVHDELIIEADPAMSLDAVCEQMSRTPPWAEGLLLRADGYECDFYKKD